MNAILQIVCLYIIMFQYQRKMVETYKQGNLFQVNRLQPRFVILNLFSTRVPRIIHRDMQYFGSGSYTSQAGKM